MNSHKVFMKRGNEWVQHSFHSRKANAERTAKALRSMGYEIEIRR